MPRLAANLSYLFTERPFRGGDVRCQRELYHCQIVEGDVATRLRHWLVGPDGNVGHIHITGLPDRWWAVTAQVHRLGGISCRSIGARRGRAQQGWRRRRVMARVLRSRWHSPAIGMFTSRPVPGSSDRAEP